MLLLILTSFAQLCHQLVFPYDNSYLCIGIRLLDKVLQFCDRCAELITRRCFDQCRLCGFTNNIMGIIRDGFWNVTYKTYVRVLFYVNLMRDFPLNKKIKSIFTLHLSAEISFQRLTFSHIRLYCNWWESFPYQSGILS